MGISTVEQHPGTSPGSSSYVYAKERRPTAVENRRKNLEVVKKILQRLNRLRYRISSGWCVMDTNSCGAAVEMYFGGDRFECGLSAVDTNSCGAAVEMYFGGDRFECGLSAVDTNSCGAAAEMYFGGDRFECGLSAVDTNSCGAAAEMCFGGDRFECGLPAVETNSCGAAAEMCFGGDRFERGLSAMDTNSCGASNLYLEVTGSHLGRDTGSLLMLFILSRFGADKCRAVQHYSFLLPPPF